MVFGKLVIFVSGNKAINDQVVPKERVNELGDYVRARISDAPTAPAQIPATTPTPGKIQSIGFAECSGCWTTACSRRTSSKSADG